MQRRIPLAIAAVLAVAFAAFAPVRVSADPVYYADSGGAGSCATPECACDFWQILVFDANGAPEDRAHAWGQVSGKTLTGVEAAYQPLQPAYPRHQGPICVVRHGGSAPATPGDRAARVQRLANIVNRWSAVAGTVANLYSTTQSAYQTLASSGQSPYATGVALFEYGQNVAAMLQQLNELEGQLSNVGSMSDDDLTAALASAQQVDASLSSAATMMGAPSGSGPCLSATVAAAVRSRTVTTICGILDGALAARAINAGDASSNDDPQTLAGFAGALDARRAEMYRLFAQYVEGNSTGVVASVAQLIEQFLGVYLDVQPNYVAASAPNASAGTLASLKGRFAAALPRENAIYQSTAFAHFAPAARPPAFVQATRAAAPAAAAVRSAPTAAARSAPTAAANGGSRDPSIACTPDATAAMNQIRATLAQMPSGPSTQQLQQLVQRYAAACGP